MIMSAEYGYKCIAVWSLNDWTRCVCETQMPPIMANSNEGQYHKDKYVDTSRKILSQEMTMYNM